MGYTLNQKAARAGSGLPSNHLMEGLHDVKITQAYEIISNGQTKGVHLDLISSDQKEGKITLWTQKANGEDVFGINQLNAIMALVEVHAINEQPGKIKVYDYDTKQTVVQAANIYPELMGKYLKIILHKATYQNQIGQLKAKYELSSALHIKTSQTASEFLDQKEAVSYGKILDYALKRSEAATAELDSYQQQSNTGNHQANQQQQNVDIDLDDDIPF